MFLDTLSIKCCVDKLLMALRQIQIYEQLACTVISNVGAFSVAILCSTNIMLGPKKFFFIFLLEVKVDVKLLFNGMFLFCIHTASNQFVTRDTL